MGGELAARWLDPPESRVDPWAHAAAFDDLADKPAGWSLFGFALLAEILLVGALLRLAVEIAVPLIDAAGVGFEIWIVGLIGGAAVAVATLILVVPWIRREGFAPPLAPGARHRIGVFAVSLVLAVVVAPLIPGAVAAVAVLVAALLARLVLLTIAAVWSKA